MTDTLEEHWAAFDRRAEELGHKLIRDEDGEVDHFICNSGFHNGPGCSVCHVSWCHHCESAEKIKPCDGGASHEAYERKRLAELLAKYPDTIPPPPQGDYSL